MRHRMTAAVGARGAQLDAVVTLGPESAARLGVPVGTQVDLGVLSYWHRNPVRRLHHMVTGMFDRRSSLARRYLNTAQEG